MAGINTTSTVSTATLERVFKAHLNAAEADLETLGNVGLLAWTPDCEHKYYRLMGQLREIADTASELYLFRIADRAAGLIVRFGD